MKKILCVTVLFAFLFMASGCGTEKEVFKTCTLKQNNVAENYSTENEYRIYGKGKTVEKVVTIETITSNDQETLDYFEEYVKSIYAKSNEVYGGYTHKVTNENGKLISETTIDYNKMNVKKFVEDNSVMKSFVDSKNKLLIDGLVQIYESTGATCK